MWSNKLAQGNPHWSPAQGSAGQVKSFLPLPRTDCFFPWLISPFNILPSWPRPKRPHPPSAMPREAHFAHLSPPCLLAFNEDKFSLSLLKCIGKAEFKYKILGQWAGLLHSFHLSRAPNEKRSSPCSRCSKNNSKTLGVEEGALFWKFLLLWFPQVKRRKIFPRLMWCPQGQYHHPSLSSSPRWAEAGEDTCLGGEDYPVVSGTQPSAGV